MFVDGCCFVLFGIDGFGCLDMCEVLCMFFEVDWYFIVIVVLKVFVDDGMIEWVCVGEVIWCYGIDIDKVDLVIV